MKKLFLVLMVLILAASANATTYLYVTDVSGIECALDSTAGKDTSWVVPVTGMKFANNEDTFIACINLYSNDSTGAVVAEVVTATFWTSPWGWLTNSDITLTMGANKILDFRKIPTAAYNSSGYVTITATGNTQALRIKAMKLKQ